MTQSTVSSEVYGDEPELLFGSDTTRGTKGEGSDSHTGGKKDKKFRSKSLEHSAGGGSPIRRKDSFAKRDR